MANAIDPPLQKLNYLFDRILRPLRKSPHLSF